jgi:hypothetical protein
MGNYYSSETNIKNNAVNSNSEIILLRELLKAETAMRNESQLNVLMLEKTTEKYKNLYYDLCRDIEKKDALNWD